MQIKLYTLFLLLFAAIGLKAQVVDTVLYQDFEEMPLIDWGIIPFGDDTTWVNVDGDGITPNGADPSEYNWFFSDQFHTDADSNGYVNQVMGSFSWMEGSVPGNRNWLILPPITVTDNSYMFHIKSAPFQLPRYMDGYSILVSTTNNDMLNTPHPFTDTIFRAASMETILGSGETLILSDYTFTPGYIHGNDLTDWDYMDIWAEGDSTLLRGFLEPHSISLAQYAGQTIYIAVLHDSDDDYYLEVDDILVTRNLSSGASELNLPDLQFVTYPNPVDLKLNVSFTMPQAGNASLQIVDMSGRLVREVFTNQQLSTGRQIRELNVAHLATGNYTIVLNVDGQLVSKVFTKR